jgi:hypothetical protein
MKRTEWIFLLVTPILGAALASVALIRSIGASQSSTAAIGYLVVPFAAAGAFALTLAGAYTLLIVLQVFQKRVRPLALRALAAWTFAGLCIAAGVWYASIQYLSDPATPAAELIAAHERYRDTPVLNAFVSDELYENPALPQAILMDRIRREDYRATRHANLSGESIDALALEYASLGAGITANLTAHPNASARTRAFLLSRTRADFANETDWGFYRDIVIEPELRMAPDAEQARKVDPAAP